MMLSRSSNKLNDFLHENLYDELDEEGNLKAGVFKEALGGCPLPNCCGTDYRITFHGFLASFSLYQQFWRRGSESTLDEKQSLYARINKRLDAGWVNFSGGTYSRIVLDSKSDT